MREGWREPPNIKGWPTWKMRASKKVHMYGRVNINLDEQRALANLLKISHVREYLLKVRVHAIMIENIWNGYLGLHWNKKA